MTHTDGRRLTRRGVLRGTAAGLAATATAGVAAAQSAFGDWFSDVSNYEGVVDATGHSEVRVTVGSEANGGNFGFDPAAIRVDPGTTVVWEWNGKGSVHNVVAEDGSYESELVAEAGHTFSQTFESEGISTYYCSPHLSLGMKGAVVVGSAASDAPTAGTYGGEGAGGEGEGEGAGEGSTVPLVFQALSGILAGAFALTIGVLGYALGRYNTPKETAVGPPDATAEGATAAGAGTAPVAAVEAAFGEGIVRELGHEEFDPTGTAALLAVYFLILVLMWAFMYFVEFLGNGPTIIG
jgi:halocyanin-like protein